MVPLKLVSILMFLAGISCYGGEDKEHKTCFSKDLPWIVYLESYLSTIACVIFIFIVVIYLAVYVFHKLENVIGSNEKPVLLYVKDKDRALDYWQGVLNSTLVKGAKNHSVLTCGCLRKTNIEIIEKAGVIDAKDSKVVIFDLEMSKFSQLERNIINYDPNLLTFIQTNCDFLSIRNFTTIITRDHDNNRVVFVDSDSYRLLNKIGFTSFEFLKCFARKAEYNGELVL
uniref:Uncharacterized protein n=1 Tax=Panagrolaimus sp. JU765 TaxID=591449 RepID=A0AC34R6C7_9BILA